jgi:hypothetical protein
MDDIKGLKSWHENDGLVGALSEQLALASDCNDLTGMPSDALQDRDAEYSKELDEFERRYWRASLMNGVVPICHEPCFFQIWIALTGERAGRL